MYWQHDLPTALTVELNRNAEPHEACTTTINLIELLGTVVTAWVMMLRLRSDTPGCAGEPAFDSRGLNTAAALWVVRFGQRLARGRTHEGDGSPSNEGAEGPHCHAYPERS
ncbi:MAG: hypothetical protein ABJZ69_15255 [Hyphomicrobiales bacterium]